MKPVLLLVLSLLWAASAPAALAAPALQVDRSVIVHATPEQVWARIGRFGDVASWHPDVASSELALGSDGRPGAERTLVLKDGSRLDDRLLGYDARHHRYRYAMRKTGPLKVSQFVAILGVKAAGRNRSKVRWSASFRGVGTDALASRAVASFFDDGLKSLQARFPGR